MRTALLVLALLLLGACGSGEPGAYRVPDSVRERVADPIDWWPDVVDDCSIPPGAELIDYAPTTYDYDTTEYQSFSWVDPITGYIVHTHVTLDDEGHLGRVDCEAIVG